MLPIVISGGKGTRLWPFSRANFPKPFCDFFDESLMQMTLRRLSQLGTPGVITVEEQKVLTQISFRDMGITPSLSLYEPFGRNTAASVALVCHFLLLQKRGNEVVGIFPADPLIQKTDKFVEAAKLAEKRAEAGALVTLGIQPTFPATGYGYIEVSEKASGLQSLKAKKFHEKPDAATAKKYLESGKFFWNAGIFIFKVDAMAKLFSQHVPQLWKQITSIPEDLNEIRKVYENIDPVSVDYAVMEKLKDNFECVPCDMGWSDVGSWSEIKKFAKSATAVEHDSKGNTVFSMSGEKTFAFVGVDDLILVDTPDALLVTRDEKSQKVGELVSKLGSNPTTLDHQFDKRPWGDYEVLEDAQHFKVKTIRVNAGQQLSYQSHKKRAEHWIVVRGEATVTLNDKEVKLKGGDHIFIPIGAKHRIRNSGKETVEFVEVQTGSYFGEDDIVRYTDDYGRA